LSNLDARIREEVRHEIKTLQQTLGITTVHVTHDRQEAMVMADRANSPSRPPPLVRRAAGVALIS
jgi:ABC-type sugar transport system ATPase subunit